MPRILLLATTTGYQTRAFEEAAAQSATDLIYATDRCDMLDDPWVDGAIPIRFHDEPASVRAILAAVRSRPIDGLLAVGDRPVVIAAKAARSLKLPGNPPEAAEAASNKLVTRARLRAAGLPVPSFHAAPLSVSPATLASSISFPCVIKPLALSGSRGVMRADDPEELARALARLRDLLESPAVAAERLASHRHVLVESFIEGREFALEGVMTGGVLKTLAIFDKPDPLDGPFFEETIYRTPSCEAPETQNAIIKAVGQAAAALGLKHGPVHAECRVNARSVFVLEVAARPIGGLCARALRFVNRAGATASLEFVLLQHALGRPIDNWQREDDASGVMMIPIPRKGIFRRAIGIDDAREINGIEDIRITAKPDQALVPLPEGASYLGFIFARGKEARVVEQALRDAHGRLAFDIDPEVRMIRSHHG